MAFKGFGNVWKSFGNEGRRASFKTDSLASFGRSQAAEQKTSGSFMDGCLGFGPFGSKSSYGTNSGATSLPTFVWKEQNSNIYRFELGSTSSSSSLSCSTKESEPTSMLTFGMEPKKFNCHSNPFSDAYLVNTSCHSGGSSRNSSGSGSTSQLDWGGVVENVFKEEIGMMASRGFSLGTK